jgi:hypothetical protein
LLIAFDPAFYYDPQLFEGVNLSTVGACLCGTVVTVPSTFPQTPVTGIDFALYAYTDWVYFSVFAERQPTPVPYPGVTVTLERKNLVGGWDVAAVDVTSADGLADLFGFGAGDYRIRYSSAGVTLAVVSAQDPGGTPFLIESGGTVVEFGNYDPTLGGCACGGGLGSFEGEDVDLLFAAAVGGGGGSGTPATRPKPRASMFSGFTLPTPTVTPTPTPTPTSSPTPSSSPTHEPTASPSPTPDPQPAAADLWWLFWLLLVLLILGIIITIIAIVRRR